MNRRDFLKHTAALLIASWPAEAKAHDAISTGKAEELEAKAKDEGVKFLEALPKDPSQAKDISVKYRMYMHGPMETAFKTNAEIKMQKGCKNYLLKVNLEQPEPIGIISWVACGLGLSSLNVNFCERAYLDGKFKTIDYTEQRKGKEAAVKLTFADDKITLTGAENELEPIMDIGQQAPLTAFWNYIMFGPSKTSMGVVRPKRLWRDNYEITNDNAFFFPENCQYGCSFGSLFESLEGMAGYKLAENEFGRIPYFATIEKLLDSKLIRERNKLRMANPRPADYEQRMKELQDKDIQIAWDIRVFLTGASVNLDQKL